MSKEGDVNQNISGDHSIQINSGKDSVVAIGPGAIAATGDIIVHSGDQETIELQIKQSPGKRILKSHLKGPLPLPSVTMPWRRKGPLPSIKELM